MQQRSFYTFYVITILIGWLIHSTALGQNGLDIAAIPTTLSSTPSISGTTANPLPQPDDYDKCYSRAITSDQYDWVDKQLEVIPERIETIEIPAEYETREEEVLVEPERVELVVIPPRYETVAEQVLVKEASQILTEKYENIVETVLTQPAYGEWIEEADPNCFSDNPSDCMVMHWREVPAIYDTLKKKVLTQVGNYDSEEVPPEYVTINKTVMVEPARVEERIIPAVYKKVKKSVLITPAKKEEVLIPAEYKTVQEKRLIKKGGESIWVEVMCPKDVEAEIVQQIQLSLMHEGIYRGAITGKMTNETKSALKYFQQNNNLPIGNLNKETLLKLGLTSK